MKRLAAGAAAGLALLAAAPHALATADVTVSRLAGDTRYATSRVVAGATFPAGATVAVLASGENFPDALAAAYLAGASNSPIVLTERDRLSDDARLALEALGIEGVVIIGGPHAVVDAVQTNLEERGYEVDRVAGGDRYETARAVAQSVPEENIGSFDSAIGRTALVATGEVFADALSAGPVAYDFGFPVVLTRPAGLTPSARTALESLEIEHVLLLGGPDALSAAVEGDIRSMGIDVDRVAGVNRMETATKIADLAIGTLGFSAAHVNLARGDFYADALSGGPHGGEERAVTLLTFDPDSLSTATETWLNDHASSIGSIHVFGGPDAVADATVERARRAAGGSA